MSMSAFGQIGAFRTLRRLPYDAEVEYLESTGTQYIDTGWTPDLRVDMSISGRTGFNTFSRGMLLSAYNFGLDNLSIELFDRYQLRFWAGQVDVCVLKTYESLRNMFDFSITYDSNSGKAAIEANGHSTSGTTNNNARILNTQSAYMGSDWRANTFRYGMFGPIAIYNPTLVRDFIPVRFTNENGVSEGVMYDKVSGTLFRNAGTGAFLYGNDLTTVRI